MLISASGSPAVAGALRSNGEPERHLFLPLVLNPRSSCPSAPCALLPDDGAQVDTLLPSFTFDAGSTQAVFSQLHICTTPTVPCGSCYPWCPNASGAGIHTLQLRDNLPGRQIWWAIETQHFDTNGFPTSVFSPVRSLTVVGDMPLLSAPVLIGPSGTVMQTTLLFQWQPVAGTLDYKLCHEMTKGYACYSTDKTEMQLSFSPYGYDFGWWVEARNYYGYGPHNKLWVHIPPQPGSGASQQTPR